MATPKIIITLLTLLIPFFESTSSTTLPPKVDDDTDLKVAMQEMQNANYFAFVMLLNMSPLDPKFLGNVTFLMPKDRMLSKTVIPGNDVPSFLQRHSIPSPLLFENLLYIPTGSFVPSSLPDYMMNVSNRGGRRSFSLNGVTITSPNICMGSSIRCHGIDGVLSAESNISLHTCSNTTNPLPTPPSPAASPSPLQTMPVPFVPPFDDDSMVPAPLPAESSQQISGSSQLPSDKKVVALMATTLALIMICASI